MSQIQYWSTFGILLRPPPPFWANVPKFTFFLKVSLNFDYNDRFQRIGEEGDEACAYYSTELNWMLDPFHAKGHTEPACTLDHADCEYHPRLEKHRELCENYNLEVLMKISNVYKVYFLINL